MSQVGTLCEAFGGVENLLITANSIRLLYPFLSVFHKESRILIDNSLLGTGRGYPKYL